MNREEAINIFRGLVSIAKANTNPTMSVCNVKNEVFIEVYQGLLSPQPDPITGLVTCGCGGKLVLHNCSDREFVTTFYVQCGNEVCRMSIGRHYDPINHCRRGEFTDAESAVKAANRAMGYKGGAE